MKVKQITASINWGKGLCVLVLLALLAIFVPAIPAFNAPAKAQPVLAQMSAERPAAMVGVIVQKSIPHTGVVEELVARLGGVVTKDLSIINAFAAELPAGAVQELATADGVKWLSLDAPMIKSGGPCSQCTSTSSLTGAYARAIGADRLWNVAPYLQGQGITVAVVDSGIAAHNDLSQSQTRVLTSVKFSGKTSNLNDAYGHGTHVAGIIGGNGTKSRGAHIGVAPKVNIVNVKVSDDKGAGLISDVIAGLQWVSVNKNKYNIRVVNLSLNSSVAESYLTSPLDAAIEVLWFNQIVVVVSSGNNGTNGILYPPANDPFVITVGAVDDRGTPSVADDILPAFSAYGVTSDGFAKPDLVAPGTNIISLLASPGSILAQGHPDHRVDGFAGGRDYYFRISGTSMSSAVTSGAVALLLQSNPTLTPDQVKHRLRATARPFAGGNGAPYLDVYAAVRGTTMQSANTETMLSKMLAPGATSTQSTSLNWDSLNWDSLNWDSLYWGK